MESKIITSETFVILPALNEEHRLGKVILGTRRYTKKIIVVDDGSIDRTSNVAERLGVLALRHDVNLGKGAAMRTGVEAALSMGAKVICFLDADGQHDPSELPKMLQKVTEGYDIVFGARKLDSKVPLIRLLGNKVGCFLINLFFGIYREDLLCGFFCFKTKVYKKIRWETSRYGVETEIVARTGKNKLKYTEVPVKTIYLDKYKGVTILDAVSVFFNIPHWLLS